MANSLIPSMQVRDPQMVHKMFGSASPLEVWLDPPSEVLCAPSPGAEHLVSQMYLCFFGLYIRPLPFNVQSVSSKKESKKFLALFGD